MIFYNPFYPQFPRITPPQSTNKPQLVQNSTQACNTGNDKHTKSQQKSNNKTFKNLANLINPNFLLNNTLQETDTLIILGLLFILYTQETKDFSLMLCLFFLLLD